MREVQQSSIFCGFVLVSYDELITSLLLAVTGYYRYLPNQSLQSPKILGQTTKFNQFLPIAQR